MRYRKSIFATFDHTIAIGVGGLIVWFYLSSFDVVKDFKIILIIVFAIFLFSLCHALVIWMGSWLEITKERVSFREQEGIFKFDVVEIPFGRITAVSASKHGPLHHLFDYGDIKMNVAGQEKPYLVHSLIEPIKIKKLLEEKLFNQ